MTSSVLMVTTTVATRADAEALARSLVESRLAACVQITQVDSVYRWDGAIETAAEHLLICKVPTQHYADAEAAIRAQHPYDVPEILAVPVVAGAAKYLDWLAEATRR